MKITVSTCPRCGGNVQQETASPVGVRNPPPTCERCGNVLEPRHEDGDDYQRLLNRMGAGR